MASRNRRKQGLSPNDKAWERGWDYSGVTDDATLLDRPCCRLDQYPMYFENTFHRMIVFTRLGYS